VGDGRTVPHSSIAFLILARKPAASSFETVSCSASMISRRERSASSISTAKRLSSASNSLPNRRLSAS
jgi:hypothetical protein